MHTVEILNLKIMVPLDTARLFQLREHIYQLCEVEGVPKQTTRLMVLAIDEAVANIIEHADLDTTHNEIELSLEISDNRIVATIRDRGGPFDPCRTFKEPDHTSFHRRGFGLYLIHKIVDYLQYERTSEGKNVLTLTKKIG